MLFITYFIILLFLYKISNKFRKITYEKSIQIILSLYTFCKKYLGWNIFLGHHTYQSLREYKDIDKLLCISNHSTIIDFVFYIQVYQYYLPEHKIILVTKREIQNIPLLKDIVDSLCIIVEDDIPQKIQEYTAHHEKTLLILFPEGKIFNKTNIRRSERWCNKLGMEQFTNVVCPHSKGLYTIMKHYNPQHTFLSIIYFKDDIKQQPNTQTAQNTQHKNILVNGTAKGKEFYQLFTNTLPGSFYMEIQEIPNFIRAFELSLICDYKKQEYEQLFNSFVIQLWRNIDYYLYKRINSFISLRGVFL